MRTNSPIICRAWWLHASVVLLCSAAPVAAQTPVDADLVVIGRVYTLDAKTPVAGAVVVREGRVIRVCTEAEARAYRGASTRWIAPRGAVVLPGLTDAHGHLAGLGRSLVDLDLVGTTSKEEIAGRVRARVQKLPRGRWVYGRGWDQNDWEVEEFPTASDLSGTDDNPVFLKRIDGHAVWVNHTALGIAGITRDTPDPPGGRIVHDADGEPTGVLVDRAVDLVSVRIPEPGDDELDEWLRTAIAHCNRLGLAGVHDAGVTARDLASFERLFRSGAMTLRIYAMLDGTDSTLVDRCMSRGPWTLAGGFVAAGAVKVYADGALGSRGAALLEPYADDPGNRGLVITDTPEIEALCSRALAAGVQVCAHAIGDRGNRIVLDAYEAALRAYPRPDHRFRIEHCQVISPEDMPRFHALGVVPSMQPTHATSDMYWAEERIGPERLAGAYAWRTLVDLGNRLPLGSDFPVESANPFWGIYAAVTRQDEHGWPEGGWYPVQRLSVEEAVRGFTVDAAWARFAENDMGRISAGMLADMTVIDRDVFAVPPSEIRTTRVLATIVGGVTVYEAR